MISFSGGCTPTSVVAPRPVADSHKVLLFYFGRFQPPTRGHEFIIGKMREEYRRFTPLLAEMIVATGATEGKSNPIPFEQKLGFLRTVAPGSVLDFPVSNVVELLQDLEKQYSHVFWYCGPDRKLAFGEMARSYLQKTTVYVVDELLGIRGTNVRDKILRGSEGWENYLASSLTSSQRESIFTLVNENSTRKSRRKPD